MKCHWKADHHNFFGEPCVKYSPVFDDSEMFNEAYSKILKEELCRSIEHRHSFALARKAKLTLVADPFIPE